MTFEDKEKNFTRLIEQSADELNKIFIQDSGEGRDFETETMYLEDVSGWLCPKDTPKQCQRNDEWYCFAEWQIENDIVKINFVKH